MKKFLALLLVAILLSACNSPVTDDITEVPLFAELPDDDIYLYNDFLRYKGKDIPFEWEGITPRQILPELLYHDFDGDGKKELAVTVYYGSGTGIALMSLHILKIEENTNAFTEYVISVDNIEDWFTEPISATLSEDGESIVLHFDGENHVISEPVLTGYTFSGVGTSYTVLFAFDGTRIKATIALAMLYEEGVFAHYFGEVHADVVFDGEGFRLENYSVSFGE